MPEETAGAGASTSRPQIPLLDNAGEYGRLYNYVKAVRELLGKGGEAYRKVKNQHPDIDSKINSGNLRVINDIIFENSNLVGLGGIKREELAKIANYSKVLANAERSGNKIPSLNAVNNVKADYDNIMQEKLEQGRDSYQESKDKLKEIRKEKNKKNGKVVSRVVFGMLAAALALGLVAGFGLGVYGIVQTAMAASFTITSGFAVGGVAVALIAGRAIVKGLGNLFRKISESLKKANDERKTAKAKFKAAKREMNQSRRIDLGNQRAMVINKEAERMDPYPGSEGISTISRSRKATEDMVSARELAAISGEFAAKQEHQLRQQEVQHQTLEQEHQQQGDESRRTGAPAPASEELAEPLTPMQEFENKYGSDMVSAIEGSYNLHFKPRGRSATTIKKEDRALAYSALLNDVASAVRMGDTKSEISVDVQVMIDEYLKARGVEISREKAKDPDIKVGDSKPKTGVTVKSEKAPAKTDKDMVNELLKSYKGKTLEPSTIMKKLKVDGPKARELAEMYKKARAGERTSEEKGAPKAPVVIAPDVGKKKSETPETLKTEPEAPAAGERTDDEIVADMIEKWSGTYGSTDSIIEEIQKEYIVGFYRALWLQKKYQDEMRKREAEAPAPEETAEVPDKEQEKKEATEDATKKVAKVEAEPEDDGWQKLTENAKKAGVPEETLNSLRVDRGMSAEEAYKVLKKDFQIAADKDKKDLDEPGSGA